MLFGEHRRLLEGGIEDWAGDAMSVTRFDWQQNQIGVEGVGNECREFAKSFTEENYPAAPKMGPVGTPDNSQSNIVAGVGVATALFLLLASPVLGPLALIGIPAVLFWFGMSKVERTSPEMHRKRLEQEFERNVASWKKSRQEFEDALSLECSIKFWKWVAWFEDVPERLWDDFVRWILTQSGIRPELEEGIHEWSSQPEFPPGPLPVPAGVSHEEYEDYCRQVVVSWGYLDAQTSRYVRDGGIDVESEELVVQCKHVAGNVRAPEVQAIFGIASSKGKRAVVFSAGGFTKDAISFANEAGVALIRLKERDAKPLPENRAAEELIGNQTSFTQSPEISSPSAPKRTLLERIRDHGPPTHADEDDGEVSGR